MSQTQRIIFDQFPFATKAAGRVSLSQGQSHSMSHPFSSQTYYMYECIKGKKKTCQRKAVFCLGAYQEGECLPVKWAAKAHECPTELFITVIS